MSDPLQEDDFRKRYPVETRGMPANLASVAAGNLAAQDAATAKVNAAARLNPLPTPGTAYATPQTDAQNYGVADAMESSGASTAPLPTIGDAHLSDIAERRSQIADQKKEIGVRLGIVSPRDAGYAAVVLASPREQVQLLAKYHALENEDNSLLREHQDTATLTAHDAHESFARERHIQAATEVASMANALAGLTKTTKPGTPEFQTGVLKIAADHPYGFGSQAGQTLLRGVSAIHDHSATIPIPEGFEQVPKGINSKGQVTFDLKPQGTADRKAVATELKDKYGLTPTEVKIPDRIESGNIVDGNFVNANKGTHFRVKNKDGDAFIIPRDEFQRFGGHIGDADKIDPVVAPSAQPPTAVSPQDQAAIAWAKANPKDPRAAAIKRLHGLE